MRFCWKTSVPTMCTKRINPPNGFLPCSLAHGAESLRASFRFANTAATRAFSPPSGKSFFASAALMPSGSRFLPPYVSRSHSHSLPTSATGFEPSNKIGASDSYQLCTVFFVTPKTKPISNQPFTNSIAHPGGLRALTHTFSIFGVFLPSACHYTSKGSSFQSEAI